MQDNKKAKVITRFAPSPTGLFHVGSYRTALFSYIFARQNNGKFILRIEDTDKARSKKEYEDNIIDSLKWLGIKYDEFFRQSERTEIYKKYIQKLIDSDHAYVSEDAIKFKNPNKKVGFDDVIRGKIEFDTTELGDFVIARNMGEPVFHLVVVVDDYEMGVTHVIRGEDHISNTPRQILIYEALGLPVPLYAHLPLVLGMDRSKLSKRKGALPVTEYRGRGYLPETIVNCMAFLGWNPGTEQEMFSIDELIKQFDITKIQKSGAIFNEEKLNWFNKKYIEKMSSHDFKNYAREFLINSEYSFIKNLQNYPKELLKWKDEKDLENTKGYLKSIINLLEKVSEKDFTKESVKSAVWPLAEEKGKGNVLWPMRVALSGKEKSPDPFISSEVLGKEETTRRLKSAYEKI